MDRESFCLEGTLVGVGQLGRSPWLASVIGVIWQRSGVSLVVMLAEVRWSGSHLNASGATLAQACLCGVTDLG